MLNPHSPRFVYFSSSIPPDDVFQPRDESSCLFPSRGTVVGPRGGLYTMPPRGTPRYSSSDLSSSFDRHRNPCRIDRTRYAATVRGTHLRLGYLRLLLTTGSCGTKRTYSFGFRLFAVRNPQARRNALWASYIPPPILTTVLLPLNRHSLLVDGTPIPVSALR